MAPYPTEFEFDVLLSNGEVVQMRPIKPEDAEREQRFFTRVGAESARYRFHRPKSELSPDELRYFTQIDYDDRMAFIALDGDEMIAVGRYDVVNHTTETGGKVAEVAFLVEDAHQGRGVGRHLLQHLTMYARLRDIEAFEAYVMAENQKMIRLFRSSGYRLTRETDSGVFTIEFPIEYSIEAREAEWEHEKRSTTASMMPLLYPTSIALLGASRNKASIGGRLLTNLLRAGFAGPVYPVNPGARYVSAVRAYPSVLDIDDQVDLAIIAVPPQHVLQSLDECGAKGVRAAVVITAGFREVGLGDAEKELVAAARRHGMRMVGPNCMGLINTDPAVQLDGQFGPRFPPRGNVAMGSQSGALGLAIIEEASELGIGLSTFVSVGNGADVRTNDLLLYWEDDPATDVILLYMESFGNPRRFGRLARRVSRKKPIVVVKSGRSSVGARAAGSHTGSLASLDVAVDALFHQSGVIRTSSLDQLFDVTKLLAHQPLPKGRRVAVISNAGGPAILTADALDVAELELPVLSDELQAALQSHLLDTASTVNPIDMVASAGPDEYEACVRELVRSDEIDAVIALNIPTTPEGAGDVIDAICRGFGEPAAAEKTLLAVLMGYDGEPPTTADGRKIPTYPYPESAARALGRAADYADWRARDEGSYVRPDGIDRVAGEAVIREAMRRDDFGDVWLTDDEHTRLFAAYGIPIAETRFVATEDDAVAVAEGLGPVAVKVVSDSALHKSDVGGVVLGADGTDEVREAFRQVTAAVDDADGAIVQRYVPGGHEVLVGMTEDPTFGPLIVFGLGGTYVELFQDVAFRINPITDADAREMIAEPRSSKVLEGYRGEPAGDVEALTDLLLRVSAMIDDLPEIVEMDMNPIKVLPPGDGVVAVDARVRARAVTSALVPSRKDIPGRLR